ncbi:MAG: hypothetical protein LBK77_07330 [Spirochaetaceae bacterium]|jgi:hypothetical protein|nr:hypothetical protein [Spirochaetaceae bacterium]
MKKRCLVVFLAFAGLAALPAATVSVIVVETGLPPGTGQAESSSVWESGVMDALFDAGHIVSNAPIMRLKTLPGTEISADLRREFDEARLGGADYLVLVVLAYPENAPEHPREVFMRLYSVSSGKIVQEISVTSAAWESSGQEFQDAKRNAGRFVPRIALKG